MTRHTTAWIGTASLVAAALAIGCEKPKEKVLEIETPTRHIEVERSTDGSQIEIEAERKDGGQITIEREGDSGVEVERQP